jgi:nucleoside-diphosphate-sugar epimerase
MDGVTVDRPLPAGDLEHVVRTAGDIWKELRGQTLLITGATGFFGRWLIESLLAADKCHNLGVSIVAVSRNPEAFLYRAPHLSLPPIKWVRGSVTTLQAEAIGVKHLDSVVHLATEADMAAIAESPAAATAVILDGTRNALEAAASLGASRFLYTSSGAVYGLQPPGMLAIPESFSGAPDAKNRGNPYAGTGEAKRRAERLLDEHARDKDMSVVVARCFTFAGPALPLDAKFAFGNFMGNALQGKPILIKGDGTQIRSYLYAADLAVWLWTLLLRGKAGRHYNVGSEEAVTMRELAEKIALEVGGDGIEVMDMESPGGIPGRYVPCTGRARDELGLKEFFSLGETVRNTAAWHRSNRKH